MPCFSILMPVAVPVVGSLETPTVLLNRNLTEKYQKKPDRTADDDALSPPHLNTRWLGAGAPTSIPPKLRFWLLPTYSTTAASNVKANVNEDASCSPYEA